MNGFITLPTRSVLVRLCHSDRRSRPPAPVNTETARDMCCTGMSMRVRVRVRVQRLCVYGAIMTDNL